ncbi:MAG: hypothetical protein GC157_09070 [Frankiales bacterium]|nr:hypothetical protein [Frankiales bacterium]
MSEEARAGQEAARLLRAAQEWLRSSAPHLAPSAPDGEPCSCPVCRAVATVREADPDTVAQWVDGAVAAAGALATQAAERARAARDGAQQEPATPGPAEASTGPAAGDDADAAPGGGGPGGEQRAHEAPATGQDGPGPRVRRIPVDPGEGRPEG